MLQKFRRDKKGVALVAGIVAVAIALLVASFILPTAMEEFAGVNTTNWTSSTVSMWDILPVMGMIGIMLSVIYFAIRRANN